MNSHIIIDDFVYKMLPLAPNNERIVVARAMAECAATPVERRRWLEHADKLEAAEREFGQMHLDFKRRAG